MLKRVFNWFLKYWPFIAVLCIGLLAGRSLLYPGYYIMHDDLQMMRQLQIEKCFLDFQIPCRWVPEMGNGYGYPLFNYYPPLPYLIGQLFRLIGFSFVDTVKITFLLSFLVSGYGMYFLSREFMQKLPSVISSAFYIWAPYHAVDVFVRGAMNESWAIALFPFILWLAYKLITGDDKKPLKLICGLAFSLSGLMLSHNLMLLIFLPFFGLWCFLSLILARRVAIFKKLVYVMLACTWAVGLSAFFTIPVILEQKYVQIESLTQEYYEYTAHFVSLNQLFISTFWGDGPSVFGVEEDQMSFSVGHFHWFFSLLVIVVLVIYILSDNSKDKSRTLLIFLFFFFMALVSLFMTHSKSTFVWKALTMIHILQFPWRFLALSILATSFLAGLFFDLLTKNTKEILIKKRIFILCVFVITSLLIFNWNFFKPVRSGYLTDRDKFSGESWRIQQYAGIRDYLPKTARRDPPSPRNLLFESLGTSEVQIHREEMGTYWAKSIIKVNSENTQIRLNIFSFPNWRVFANGQLVPTYVPDAEEFGRIHFDLVEGEYLIYAQLMNTSARTISNFISFFSWLIFLYICVFKRFTF